MAHKKGQGSVKNGRDSVSKRLGVKKFGSQAVVAGGFAFTAGQIALDPTSGQLVGGGDVVREAEQVLANLEAVLSAAGTSLARAVRCDVFLADLGDFGRRPAERDWVSEEPRELAHG